MRLALILFATLAHSTTYTSSQNGNWNLSSTWGGAGTPGDGDNAIIGHAVTITASATVGTSGPSTPCVYSSNNCSRPTVAINGTGVTSLSTGNHFVYYTIVDGSGRESGYSPESASFAAVNGGTPPRVTFPAAPPSGHTFNLYSGTASAAEKLYVTGITGTTYDMLIAEPAVTTHPGLGNTAIRCNGTGGSLTLGDGTTSITLTLRGDIGLANCVYTFMGESTLKFDTTQAENTTFPYVVWAATANGQTAGRFLTSTTSSSHWAFITSQTGGASGRFDVPLGSVGWGARWEQRLSTPLSYLEIDHCGDANMPCFPYTSLGTSNVDVSLSHVTCDTCGELFHAAFPNVAALNLAVDYTDTHSGVGTYAMYLSLTSNATAPVGTRRITGSGFDKLARIPQTGLTVSNTVLYAGYETSGISAAAKAWTSFDSNLVRSSTVLQLNTDGDASNNYWLWDSQTVGNPHFIGPSSALASIAYSGNVFEYTGPNNGTLPQNDMGDAMLHFDTAGITVTMDHNIVLPNTSSTDSSGTLITLFQANSSLGATLIHHNTYTMGNWISGANLDEPNSGTNLATGQITFRDNLAWNFAGSAAALKIATVKNFANPALSPGNFLVQGDYNSGCNLSASTVAATSTTARGYWMKSSFQLGAHDVDFTNCSGASSPGLIDPTRNFSKWSAVTFGSTGTDIQKRADGLSKLLQRNSRTFPYTGYSIPDLVLYIQNGFAPSAATLQNSDSSGTGTIGAVAWTTAPATRYPQHRAIQ
jgi:hypothetical protein